jgi:hypothetical protein
VLRDVVRRQRDTVAVRPFGGLPQILWVAVAEHGLQRRFDHLEQHRQVVAVGGAVVGQVGAGHIGGEQQFLAAVDDVEGDRHVAGVDVDDQLGSLRERVAHQARDVEQVQLEQVVLGCGDHRFHGGEPL